MIILAKTTDMESWVRCGRCGHKLFRLTHPNQINPAIEIKCHSCKALNYTDLYDMEFNEKEEKYDVY